jgi:hypothetical protein
MHALLEGVGAREQKGLSMDRRSFLASLGLSLCLAPALAASSARADIVYEPPPQLEVRPEPATYATAPTSVTLVVTNPSAEAIELEGPRLIVLTAGVRVPVRVSRLELDGRAHGVWDPFTIPARGSVRMTLAFDALPASALAAGRVELSLRLQGASEATFTLTQRR